MVVSVALPCCPQPEYDGACSDPSWYIALEHGRKITVTDPWKNWDQMKTCQECGSTSNIQLCGGCKLIGYVDYRVQIYLLTDLQATAVRNVKPRTGSPTRRSASWPRRTRTSNGIPEGHYGAWKTRSPWWGSDSSQTPRNGMRYFSEENGGFKLRNNAKRSFNGGRSTWKSLLQISKCTLHSK